MRQNSFPAEQDYFYNVSVGCFFSLRLKAKATSVAGDPLMKKRVLISNWTGFVLRPGNPVPYTLHIIFVNELIWL